MMEFLRILAVRIAALFGKQRRDEELSDELRSHLEMAIELNLRRGMNREQARREALLALGGVEQIKEIYREQRGVPMIETILKDLRYGLRMLRLNPGFTTVAVLSIALGIGANTAIFSLTYALLLRWLPVPNPRELMQVSIVINGKRSDSFSYPMIKALAERRDIFANLGGFSGTSFTVGPPPATALMPGALVSGGFFPALGLHPTTGRLLTPDDDKPGAALVTVISDGYWERQFHRDPGAIGGTLLIEGHPTIIVGVTPLGFTGATVGETADITVTFQAFAQLSPERAGLLHAGNHFNRILARPAPSFSLEQVRARLRTAWPAMAVVSVNPGMPAKRRDALLASTLEVSSGATGWTSLRDQYAKPLYILICISGLVLLVACANVANLLLARSTARRREIAIRLAIGAGRGRVIRQLLVESLLLASMGAAAGLFLAHFGSRFLLESVAGARPILLDVGLNTTVLGFTVAVAVITGLFFGLAPALRATSTDPGVALKSSERTSAAPGGRLASALVSTQVALSLLLVVGAGLFIRTLRNLQAIDLGFHHQGVLLLHVDGRRAVKTDGSADARLTALYREGLQSIAQLKGVDAVSVSNTTPVSRGIWSQAVMVDGQRGSEEEPVFSAVSPSYFAALSIPVVAGRTFTERDITGAPPVVMVNQEFVRRFIPSGPAIGRRVSASDSRYWQNMEIVGVTGNSVPYLLREPLRACVYVPFFQQPAGGMGFGIFEIKVAGSLRAVSSAVEQLMRPRAPGVPLKARPFTAQIEDAMRSEILLAELAGFFGALALLLAAVGLYGLLAYMVTQRTSEIGIRLALGAQPRQVVWMVLAGALRLLMIGIALGLPVAWWASRLVSTMLYGLKPTDPLTIAGSVLVLAAAGLAAGFLPARRASRVDPMAALKYE